MVNAVLPVFRYHPEPLKTGQVITSDKTCTCCCRPRGYIYRGPVYASDDLSEALCPWCIADGSAATTFGATFTDEMAFQLADVEPAVVEEVARRTPGYVGWQQENWLTHCNDACAYLGFPSQADLTVSLVLAVAAMRDELTISDKQWAAMQKAYVPGSFEPQGHVGLYHFRCLHCGTDLLACDSN